MDDPKASSKSLYRPELDGLRCLAVLPVILLHAGFEVFGGGFIGVDVFFVLSGFLITSIIQRELISGTYSLRQFYIRRARRILPALTFIVLTFIPLGWFFMLPDPLENFGQSLVATTLFSNNLLLTLTAGYWDLASEFKPLIHTWSLGVEEHYYIFFPLLFSALWKLKKRTIIAMLTIIAFVSVMASYIPNTIFAGYLSEDKVTNAKFYLLPTRAWEILIGSIVALIVFNKKRPSLLLRNALSVLGIVILIICLFCFNDKTPHPSLYTLIPVIATALIIAYADDETIAGRVLGLRVFVFLGLISYSIYLWHQPILSFGKIISKNEPSIYFNALLLIVTIALSFITWKYIEKPFRDSSKVSTAKVFWVIVPLNIGILLFGFLSHKKSGFSERFFGPEVKQGDLDEAYNEGAFSYAKGSFQSDASIKVLVCGNSFGRDIVNVIKETYDMNQIEIIYSDARIRRGSFTGISGLLDNCDVAIFANAPSREIAQKLLGESRKVFFIGGKHFGYNLNWITRMNRESRILARNEPIMAIIEEEAYVSQNLSEFNYISIMSPLSNDEGVLFTDHNGNLISGDRTHLTRQGAIFIGEKIFKPSSLSEVLPLP